jgi:phage major head subunit gpT-like protein
MIVNAQNLSMAFTGFKAAFANAFAGAAIDYDQISMEVPSTTAIEAYAWLGATTGFREWVGDRVLQKLKQHNYTITNKDFENTVEVPRNAFADDQYGIYAPLMSQLGQDAKEHPATLLYALLKAGFATTCYDGQFFFDTDHPVLDSTGAEVSVSNSGGGSGTPWFLLDTTRVMRPLILQKRSPYNFVSMDSDKDENVFMRKKFIYGVDARLNVGYGLWQLAYGSKATLDATSFNAAYAGMQAMKGDNGRPLGLRPKLLVVPPSLRATAMELVKAERNAAGATNINKDVVDVLSTPWLA